MPTYAEETGIVTDVRVMDACPECIFDIDIVLSRDLWLAQLRGVPEAQREFDQKILHDRIMPCVDYIDWMRETIRYVHERGLQAHELKGTSRVEREQAGLWEARWSDGGRAQGAQVPRSSGLD